MKVVAQEDEFGTDYIKESYQYSPKAIELVISAIEAVEEFLAAPGNCSAPHDVTRNVWNFTPNSQNTAKMTHKSGHLLRKCLNCLKLEVIFVSRSSS